MTELERLEREAAWLRAHGSPLRILGLPEHADLQEVKTRYKDLLFETHPDTAVAAARKAGVDPLTYVAGTGGALVTVEAQDEALRRRAVQQFELLQQAYKMATNPLSIWHQNGSAPAIYREIAPPRLIDRIVNPTNIFAFVALVLGCIAAASFAAYLLPTALDELQRRVDPKFHAFMVQQEAEEARLRSLGIEPDPDPMRLAPAPLRVIHKPGKELADPAAAEAELAKSWKRGGGSQQQQVLS